jgi:hypothetical protein
MINEAIWRQLQEEFTRKDVQLVAVSKTKTEAEILQLYNLGQRHFGENYVQELIDKQEHLPIDIKWHFIGHLQSNKVKYIAPFIHLIHAIDNFNLLKEVNKQALKNDRVIDVLLQMHVATEETKFGLDDKELTELLDIYTTQKNNLKNIRICGIMGMATNTEDLNQVRAEFSKIYATYKTVGQTYFPNEEFYKHCSMGMSGDYEIAIEEGSNMVRIGSLLFGTR